MPLPFYPERLRALALRDLDAAHRYAVSLRHDLGCDGDALFRLARVSYLRGSYGVAASLFREFLDHRPNSAKAYHHLGDCHLRQGSPPAALDCYRRSGGLAPDEERWLSGTAESGRLQRRTDWFGRKTTPMPRLQACDRRVRVLSAPLRFLARDLTEIDLWINSCQYVSDERLFGEADYWQTPDQTERNSMGDCEDFAIWAWVQLLRQGARSRVVLGALYADYLNPAWVQIYTRGAVGVLECTPTGYNQVIGSRHAPEYRPVFSIDKSLRWYAHA
jgi:predicted transglutaminase-like cysteine proteinase